MNVTSNINESIDKLTNYSRDIIDICLDDIMSKFHWHMDGDRIVTDRNHKFVGKVFKHDNYILINIFGHKNYLYPTNDMDRSVKEYNDFINISVSMISELLNKAKGYTPKKKQDTSSFQMSLDI